MKLTSLAEEACSRGYTSFGAQHEQQLSCLLHALIRIPFSARFNTDVVLVRKHIALTDTAKDKAVPVWCHSMERTNLMGGGRYSSTQF